MVVFDKEVQEEQMADQNPVNIRRLSSGNGYWYNNVLPLHVFTISLLALLLSKTTDNPMSEGEGAFLFRFKRKINMAFALI